MLTDNDRKHLQAAIRAHSRELGYAGVRLPEPLQVLYEALSGQERTITVDTETKAEDGRMPPHLLTYRETAQRLNVSERTVRRYVHASLLEVVRLGRVNRIHPDALEEFLEAQRAGSRFLARFAPHD